MTATTKGVDLAEIHEALLRIEREARAIAWVPLSSGAPSRLALRRALETMDELRERWASDVSCR